MLVSGAPVGAFHHAHAGAGEARPRRARRRGRRARHLQRRPPLRRDGPLADRRRSRRTACSPGSGPSRSATRFDARLSRGAAGRAGRRRSRRCCSTSAWWRGSATSTSARRSGARASRRCGWPRDVTPAEAEALVAAVRAVLAEAIAAGGSSLARLPPGGRRARLLPALLRGLRPRGRALPRGRAAADASRARRARPAGRASHCPACQRSGRLNGPARC